MIFTIRKIYTNLYQVIEQKKFSFIVNQPLPMTSGLVMMNVSTDFQNPEPKYSLLYTTQAGELIRQNMFKYFFT